MRGQLTLAMLLAAGPDTDRLEDVVRGVAHSLDLKVKTRRGMGDNAPRRGGRAAVVVIGAPLRAAAVASVTARIAGHGANIDRIRRLSRYPVTTVELDISGSDIPRLRRELALEAAEQGVDIAVSAGGLDRRGRRLVVMDVDSTLIQQEVIELLAARCGRAEEVAAVTERAMRGEPRLRRVAPRAGPGPGGSRRPRPRGRPPRSSSPPAPEPWSGPSNGSASWSRSCRAGSSRSSARWRRSSGSTERRPTVSRSRTGVSPATWSATSSTAPARSAPCAVSLRTPAFPSPEPWPSATAPTTSTCWPPPASASPSTPSPWSANRPTPPSTSRTSTPSCSCSGSAARTSRTPTRPTGHPRPRHLPSPAQDGS